ncbi:MAG: hypothetical protein ABEN55_00620 [Bradymonadaceae bacterium]
MTQQFGRTVYVQIGRPDEDGREFRDLRINFDVKHTLSRSPNEATIKIWNPSPNSIAHAQRDDTVVRLFAGYETPRLLFTGHPKGGGVKLRHEPPDKVLEIDALDGGRKLANARVNVSFGQKVGAEKIVEEMADELDVPRGVIDIPNEFELEQGGTFVGPVRDVMDRIATSVGADFSIQNGTLQLLDKDGDTGVEVSSYSYENGTLLAINRKDKGVEVKTTLDGTVRPGDRFDVDEDELGGIYKARDVRFKGDSGYADDFVNTMTAREA